jgi:hypothetical protein
VDYLVAYCIGWHIIASSHDDQRGRRMKYIVFAIALFAASSVAAQTIEVDTVQGGNNTTTFDTKIYEGSTYLNANFGGYPDLTLWSLGGNRREVLIRFTGIDTIGVNRVIDSLVLELYASTVGTSPGNRVVVYELLKSWGEGTRTTVGTQSMACCWNAPYYGDADSAWGTIGANSASDAGEQGGIYDRKATPLDTTVLSTAAAWYRWNLGSVLPTAWYDSTKAEYGVILEDISSGLGQAVLVSSENTTAALRPRWIIYHHDAPSTGPTGEPCEWADYRADDCYKSSVRASYVPNFTSAMDTIRMVGIINNAYLDTADVRKSFDTLNRIFEDNANIHVTYSISNINATYWTDNPFFQFSAGEKTFFALHSLEPDSQCHVFFYNTSASDATPGNEGPDIEEPIRCRSLLVLDAVAHETGHQFWLQHTHAGIGNFSGAGADIIDCDNPCREWPQTYNIPDSANYINGDGCPDTKADPAFNNVTGLPWSEADTVCQDSSFGTITNTNIMSYGRAANGLLLTEDQVTILRCVLETYFPMWKIADE